MTYPQQYPQAPQPQYPQAPGYPQAPQPQYPAAPGYPQAPQPQYPAAPPQGYAPAPQPQYPQPQPQQTPQLTSGTLDAFYQQPARGGGAGLKFDTVGTTYTVIVARPITNGDIEQQTNRQGVPQTFKDGRPKFVMKVPVQMQPTSAYPDGQAQWYVKGQARDELVRAMAEAGAPEGPPEAGAILQITCTGERPIPGFNPAKQFQVVYRRPNGAQPVAPQQAAPVPQPVQQAAVPVTQPAPQAMPQPVPVPAQQPAAPAPAMAGELSPEQQALLAQLTGQPTG